MNQIGICIYHQLTQIQFFIYAQQSKAQTTKSTPQQK